MAKPAIPRFLVTSLVVGSLLGTGIYLTGRQRDWAASTTGAAVGAGKSETPPPPKASKPDRPDADLWLTWKEKSIPEMLAALAPAPTGDAAAAQLSLDLTPPAGTTPDLFQPRFSPRLDAAFPSAESIAALDGAWLFSGESQPPALRTLEGGALVDRTAAAGLAGFVGGRVVLPADFDRDGDTDLFIGRTGVLPDSLLRRTSPDAWEDITVAAGLLEFLDHAAAAWVDYDRDGWLDLCVVQHPPVPGSGSLIRLFHNESGSRFTDVATRAGLSIPGRISSLLWRDFDDDGYPDLALSLTTPSAGLMIWLSQPGTEGAGRSFTDATAAMGLSGAAGGGPLAAADFDGDGRDDLAAAAEGTVSLFITQPGSPARFEDRSRELTGGGVAQPRALIAGDLDLDGLPDLVVIGATARAWWHAGALAFREIPEGAGFATAGPVTGVLATQADDRGTPAYLIAGGSKWHSSFRLAENAPALTRSRVRLRLNAPDGVAPGAPGARVELVTRDRFWIYRTQTRTIDEPEEIIGLDEAVAIESLTIRWPDRARTQTRLEKLPVDHLFELSAGSAAPVVTPLPPAPATP